MTLCQKKNISQNVNTFQKNYECLFLKVLLGNNLSTGDLH